ncbi:hypothetical protein L4D76_01600 [Photobacterium sagamiensis]|uniref:hypothetical protein n=1 Tax=Photobacterium sagamiensis TaxID=2910241 RepID=UPI003D10015F
MDELYKPAVKLHERWGIEDPERPLQTCDDPQSVTKNLISIHAALKRLYPARNITSMYQIDVVHMRNRELDSCRPIDLIQQDIQENAAMLRHFYESMLQR